MLDELSDAEINCIEEHFNLSKGKEPSLALWIIGRPASGKTTTAALLKDALRLAGRRVEFVDGDTVRSILNGVVGYSVSDRLTIFRKYVHLNQILQGRGVIPITATIAGFRQFRRIVRNNLQNPRFIYLDCPMEVAAGRDQKGHYAKALAGEMRDFVGFDIAFEPPVECEMRLDSSILKPAEIIARIMEHFNQTGLLQRIRT